VETILAGDEEEMKSGNKYLDKITKLISQTRPRLSQTHPLEYKNCFGAVAGYVEGRIFITCGKFGVALKLPPKKITDLLKESGVKPLQYFPNGHVKKDYAVLPKRILEDRSQFKKLIDTSLKFVLSQNKQNA
jgi:TfoX/Sxy family transcriptional regulator of competence genes